MLDNDDVEIVELQKQQVAIMVWIAEWKRAWAVVEEVEQKVKEEVEKKVKEEAEAGEWVQKSQPQGWQLREWGRLLQRRWPCSRRRNRHGQQLREKNVRPENGWKKWRPHNGPPERHACSVPSRTW